MKKTILAFAAICMMSACLNKNPASFDSIKEVQTIADANPTARKEVLANANGNTNETNESDDLKTPSASQVVQKVPSQIIKNANIQFQVKDVQQSHQKISDWLKQYNAYFGSDNKTTNSYQIDDNMVIRVPAAGFEKLMDEIMKESVYTNSQNITAEDVTAQFVDIEARLKTKKEIELRYLALLRQSAKVTDILEVEEKLRVIREEIEAAEGRLKLLKDQVGYSTITLNIYQKLDYSPEPEMGFFSNLKEAFIKGWRSVVDFFIGLVRIWPFVIILGVVIFFLSKRLAKKK